MHNFKGFYEFFSGGGMARLGLGNEWRCLFANELNAKKAATYMQNFGPAAALRIDDIAELTASDLPESAMLAWASFPCQDLSLAGNGKGLRGERSGTFHAFGDLIGQLNARGRGVPIIVLENVVGAITSNQGNDFSTIIRTLMDGGYRVGPLVIDAVRFVPQSRPRLFICAINQDVRPPHSLIQSGPGAAWHNNSLSTAFESLPDSSREAWIWWRLPEPCRMTMTLTELIEDEPEGVSWHTAEETERLLSMMSETNREKVRKAQAYGKPIAGTVYKRIRALGNGSKTQRAEIRFDQISGCLRTPLGGSSRQIIVVVEGKSIRSRLLSPREAARLMGVPEWYELPKNYNEAYHLMGDGVVVPVVEWLREHLLSPLAETVRGQALKVA